MLFVNSAIVSLRNAGVGCVNGPSVPEPPVPVTGTLVPAAPLPGPLDEPPGPLGEPPGPLTLPTQPAATSAETATLTQATFAKTLIKAHLRLQAAIHGPFTVLTM